MKTENTMPISNEKPSIETRSFSDEPIQGRENDRLNRYPFAKQVASLIKFSQPELRIIGLYGGWGEGKTSVLNMALNEYKNNMRRGEPTPIIVRFLPWEYSAQTNLVKALFSTIAQHVQTSGMKERDKRKIAQGLIAVSRIASVYCSYRYPEAIPAIKAANAGIKKITKWISKNPTLEVEKKNLEKALDSCPHRIIVVLDDVDRLLHPEIRELVRTVKANGDLPNLTWIFLCDREIVAKAIAKDLDTDETRFGHLFLDKIIPIGLDLPKVSREVLFAEFLNLLQNAFQSVLANAYKDLQADPMESVRLFCVNMRNVKRLANSILISLQMLQAYQGNNECPSIHFGDFVNLEAWRLFEPEFYNAVFKNRDTLLMVNVKKEEEWFEKNLVTLVAEDGRETARTFIKERFDWTLDASSDPTKRHFKRDVRADNRYRISSPNHFDTYFSYRMLDSEVSRAEEDNLIQSAADAENMSRMFLSLDQRGKLPEVLHIFENPPEFKTKREDSNYLVALWTVAEKIDSNEDFWRTSLFNYSRQTRIMRCSLFFMRSRYVESEARMETLQELMSGNNDLVSQPLFFAAMDCGHYEHESSFTPLLDRNHFIKAKRLCLERLETLHSEGKLSRHPNSFEIRKHWRMLAGDERFFKITSGDYFRFPDAYDNLIPFVTIHERAEGVFYPVDIDALEKGCNIEALVGFLESHPHPRPQFKEMAQCISFAFAEKRKHLPYGDETQIKKILELRQPRNSPGRNN